MNEQQQRSFNAILQALNILANAHIANVQGEQPAPQAVEREGADGK